MMVKIITRNMMIHGIDQIYICNIFNNINKVIRLYIIIIHHHFYLQINTNAVATELSDERGGANRRVDAINRFAVCRICRERSIYVVKHTTTAELPRPAPVATMTTYCTYPLPRLLPHHHHHHY